MSVPTTPEAREMLLAEIRRECAALKAGSRGLRIVVRDLLQRPLGLVRVEEPVFLWVRRPPVTDDMRQMLDDLGIEPAESPEPAPYCEVVMNNSAVRYDVSLLSVSSVLTSVHDVV